MCIRDSSWQAFLTSRHRSISSQAAANAALIESAKSVQAPVCLLYTSDAADDLLCVDLGGRRIIKKKNHYFSNSSITNFKHDHMLLIHS